MLYNPAMKNWYVLELEPEGSLEIVTNPDMGRYVFVRGVFGLVEDEGQPIQVDDAFVTHRPGVELGRHFKFNPGEEIHD